MDHNDIRHKLSEYIDGAVTPGEKAAIEEHLKTCAECSDALRELRKTIEHIHAVENVEPPAWMTQKIMAKVREEQEAKKGFWQRVLLPLFTTFPVQAVAILFITVTAYYLYSSMDPGRKYSEAPVATMAKKEAPEAGRLQDEQKALREAAPASPQAPQKPAYKSLDMKYEYERPAPPVPAEPPAASAPAPAQREAPAAAKDETDRVEPAEAPRAKAAAPSLMTEQATQAAGAVQHRSAVREPAPGKLQAGNAASANREAEALLDITEHFAKTDLPGKMKVKGLHYAARQFATDLPDLAWMQDTAAYRSRPCTDRYVVDVSLSGKLSKYLYCYDHARVTLLGVYELRNGAWSEAP